MDETELKKLKLKCNKLIDEALRLEGELKEKDEELKELQEKKNTLERKRQQEKLSAKLTYPITIPSPPIIETTVAVPEETEQEGTEALDEMGYQEEPREFMELIPSRQEYPVSVTPSIPPEKIFEMIQILSSQLDARPREEVVIRKLSFSARMAEVISDITGKILKFLILGILMLLLSVGATILLNAQTRDMLFDFVKSCIGGGV